MLLLPEKRVCYLLPVDKELSTPRKLIHDMDGAKVKYAIVRHQSCEDISVILVPRGCAPFGQHQESRPLALTAVKRPGTRVNTSVI